MRRAALMLPRSALAAKPKPPQVDARPLLPEVMAPPRPKGPPLEELTLVEKPEVVLAAKAAEDLRAQEGVQVAQVLVVDGS